MKADINLQTIFSNKILCLLLTVIVVCSVWTCDENNAYALTSKTPFPDLGAQAAVVIDATTGQILFEQNKDQSMFPASTTKLMTALLAAENLDPKGEVAIDAETALVGEATMNLEEGEILTVENLVAGLLLVSGNDAAVALAKAVSGDVPTFAALMNQRAKELGATNTNFTSPNGLHDDLHYTTAFDMALIAKEALKLDLLRKIVGTPSMVVPATNLTSERQMSNSNQLLRETPYKYEGATGMKTGFTPQAGNCLVASAKRDGTEVIAVILNSSELGRFGDATVLLNYAFENYRTVTAIEGGELLGEVKVKRGAVSKVTAAAKEPAAATLPINASDEIVTTKFLPDKKIEAPVKKGQKLGVVEIYQVGESVGRVDAVALNDVARGGPLSVFGISDKTADILKIVLIIAAAALIILLWIYIVLKRREIRKKKKRKMEREKERQRKSPQEEAWEAWMTDPRNRQRPRR